MPADNRTEKPTRRRRDDARKKGQLARSPDLSGSLVLIGGITAISFMGTGIAESLASCLRAMLSDIANPQGVATAAGLNGLEHVAMVTMLVAVGPVAGTCVVMAIIAGVLQGGGRLTPQALKVDLHRISPVSGAKNLLGPNLLFEAGKAVAKIAIVAAVAAMSLLPGMTGLASKVGLPPMALGALGGGRALEVAQRAALAYLLIGLVDYAWRRHRHEQNLRMTKQELKEEERRHSVSGEVKMALRRRQLQAARARMMAAVPEADVVIANPTHFAVALRYDGSKAAPEVIAKGQDLIAAQIRKVAAEHDVPVITDPPLARALFSSTEIGQVIPAELYIAVARVLAFVYRLANRRSATVGAA
jgi:flagellar biosynthetic protein FlhB